ncbi:hypothetical protein V1478_017525 [Vespula squamosa]|uniref:Uncharacterized protein n=1 Tax=Vespula squamosa TaxID=30214 RepID=A0ABD1ZX48_VESSQ
MFVEYHRLNLYHGRTSTSPCAPPRLAEEPPRSRRAVAAVAIAAATAAMGERFNLCPLTPPG